MTATANTIPLAVYVHLPWCIKKCPYCDFNSHALGDQFEQDRYVDAILRDLEFEFAAHSGRTISSIFFGGGTPSLFDGNSFARILEGIDRLWGVEQDAEVTVEANPGAADAARFSAFRNAGVNRLSIGVQSFNDDALHRLGRVHDSVAAFEAVSAARQGGFERINLDIMFALPGQDIDDCLSDIRSAIACDVSHLSCYQLTIEPNTAFFHKPPPLPDEDAGWAMQQGLQAELSAAGFEQYEVSAYAMAGQHCRHNHNYWLYGDYIGVGAGAHGKTTADNRISRRRKQRHPQRFMQSAGDSASLSGSNEVSDDERAFEFMLNALRLTHGFSRETMLQRTGLNYAAFDKAIGEAVQRGLIRIEDVTDQIDSLEKANKADGGNRDQSRPDGPDRHIIATELGQRFLNDLTALFLPDTSR